MKKKRRGGLSKRQAKAFLATERGKEWLERKIAEKHEVRPDPGPAPERFTRTKYPFVASINGERCVVTREEIIHDPFSRLRI